jgi:large subunit ribosomal protein L7/L12
MSVLELYELVKALEEEFGVSAAATAVAAAGPAAAASEEAEEKTNSTSSSGSRRREDQGHQGCPRTHRLGLKEAKDVVDGALAKSRKASTRKKPRRSWLRSRKLARPAKSSKGFTSYKPARIRAGFFLFIYGLMDGVGATCEIK